MMLMHHLGSTMFIRSLEASEARHCLGQKGFHAAADLQSVVLTALQVQRAATRPYSTSSCCIRATT